MQALQNRHATFLVFLVIFRPSSRNIYNCFIHFTFISAVGITIVVMLEWRAERNVFIFAHSPSLPCIYHFFKPSNASKTTPYLGCPISQISISEPQQLQLTSKNRSQYPFGDNTCKLPLIQL